MSGVGKNREGKYLDLVYPAIEYLRELAKELEEYQEGDDLAELADELEHTSDQVQDILSELDEGDEE